MWLSGKWLYGPAAAAGGKRLSVVAEGFFVSYLFFEPLLLDIYIYEY